MSAAGRGTTVGVKCATRMERSLLARAKRTMGASSRRVGEREIE